jgi:uncharacterized protein
MYRYVGLNLRATYAISMLKSSAMDLNSSPAVHTPRPQRPRAVLPFVLEAAPFLKVLVSQAGASNLRVFGSVARGEETPDSDIDFLIDWPTSHSLFERMALKEAFEERLQRRVDLLLAHRLHWLIRDKVLAEAVPL